MFFFDGLHQKFIWCEYIGHGISWNIMDSTMLIWWNIAFNHLKEIKKESTYTSTCTPFQYAEIEQRPSETLGIHKGEDPAARQSDWQGKPSWKGKHLAYLAHRKWNVVNARVIGHQNMMEYHEIHDGIPTNSDIYIYIYMCILEGFSMVSYGQHPLI